MGEIVSALNGYIIKVILRRDERLKVKVIPALGGGEPTEVEVQETDNVGALKKRICEIKHVPPDVTRLTFRGKAPDESSTLKSLGVKEGDKFVLITRTIGG